ncbi:unnamed protein product [Polarella glacialis]|uniref:Uncharacterized protein n=2 Tax=Polarella glacialis TaxID=89957 RepID=A0A813IZX6_POLGL|nr:unnamed protein product [Polarella glacialis]
MRTTAVQEQPPRQNNYNTTLAPAGDLCCEDYAVDHDQGANTWNHVGNGRGSFRKVENYEYVGPGQGQFEVQQVPLIKKAWQTYGACICCLLLVLIIVLLAHHAESVARRRRDNDVSEVSSSSNKVFGSSRDNVFAADAPPPRYECATSEAEWPVPHTIWCCENMGVGCTTTMMRTSPPSTTPPVATTWILVPVHEGGPPWQSATPTLPPAVLRVPDCAGLPSSWNSYEASWCCHHEGLCLTGATPIAADAPPPTAEPAVGLVVQAFDCMQGYENWQGGWSPSKKTWCCGHHNRGCELSQMYECSSGDLSRWSMQQSEWCCRHHAKGCGNVV